MVIYIYSSSLNFTLKHLRKIHSTINVAIGSSGMLDEYRL